MSESNAPQTPAVPRGRGCGWVFFILMMVVAALGGTAMGVFVWILEDAKTTIEALEDFRPKIGSKIYTDDGTALGEFTIEQRQLIRISDMPLHMVKAFIATEDDKFYEHKGVRPLAILNGAMDLFRKGRARGASTVTQQVVRNVEDLQVGLDRTMKRKVTEAIVALQVERKFTKDEILELYLNQAFLGISAYGVEAAAQQYFAKSARDVTLAEAAMLAGLLRLPNKQEPFNNPENALSRRNIVLEQMLRNNFITKAEYDVAILEDMDASVITPEERIALDAAGESVWKPNRFQAPYFVEEVRKFLLAEYNQEDVFEDGLEIHTTLDMKLQEAAEDVLLTALDAFDEKKLTSLTAQGKEAEFVPVSGALVCLDNRDGMQGFVRAMVGGRNFETNKFNNATQAHRQAGSSVKPFVWAAAIGSGMTPSTVFFDEPFERRDGAGKPWRPKNFGSDFYGPIPLRHALEKSINIVSVKLIDQLGFPLVRSYLQSCGITTPIDDAAGLTLALGSHDVLVLDQAVAYSTIANGGDRYDPIMITEIKDRDGLQLYDYTASATSEINAIDPRVAYVVTSMLEGVCEPGNGYYPTGWRTHVINRPRGGKTGTTNESRNVWFCGFTKQYTCVVWVGYKDNRPLGRGADYTGGRLACPIWTDFMQIAHEGLPVEEFDVPESGITFYNIDRFKGTQGGTYKEAYLTGTAPPLDWPYGGDTANIDSSDEALLESF